MVHDMFDDVLKMVSAGRDPQDRARIYIDHPTAYKPIVVHLRPLHLLTPDVIIDRMNHVLQSAESMKLVESFKIKVGLMRVPK